MRFTTLVVPLLASLAMAGPVKRDVLTVWETEVVTITKFGWRHGLGFGHGHGPWKNIPAVTPTSSSVQLPTSVLPASQSTTQAILSSTSITSTPAPAVSNPQSSVQTSPSTTSAVSTAAVITTQPAQKTAFEGDSSGYAPYVDEVLGQHNVHRGNHSAAELVWDDDLVSIASEHAHSCYYGHSRAYGDGNYGQNIGAGYTPDEVPRMVTNGMYNDEIMLYPGYGIEPNMTNFESWGHFSQIVWLGTQRVGCYTHKCDVLSNTIPNVAPYFTVCNFRPMGNVDGSFAANVLKPLGEEIVVVNFTGGPWLP